MKKAKKYRKKINVFGLFCFEWRNKFGDIRVEDTFNGEGGRVAHDDVVFAVGRGYGAAARRHQLALTPSVVCLARVVRGDVDVMEAGGCTDDAAAVGVLYRASGGARNARYVGQLVERRGGVGAPRRLLLAVQRT